MRIRFIDVVGAFLGASLGLILVINLSPGLAVVLVTLLGMPLGWLIGVIDDIHTYVKNPPRTIQVNPEPQLLNLKKEWGA